MPTRQRRRARAYLIGIALGLPSIVAVWVSQAADDAMVRFVYPLLAAYLVTAAVVLVRRPQSLRAVERRTYELVTGFWLVRMGAELLTGNPEAGWESLTPWTFLGLPLLAVMAYVVHDTRVALRFTVAVPLVAGLIGTAGLLPGALATEDWGRMLELLRYEVYLGVTTAMTHALALHKDDAAESRLEAERLRLMAHADPLTGLPNRRRVQDALERAVAAAESGGWPVSVLVFDIDHFKAVNDTHGHQAGDAVLRAAALAASEQTRGRDTLGRWGGEEFLAVLPGADRHRATGVADRMRLAVAAATAELGLGVTASFGVAQHVPGESADALVREADRMMYAAKAAGRDTVRTVPAARQGGRSAVEGRDEPAQQG